MVKAIIYLQVDDKSKLEYEAGAEEEGTENADATKEPEVAEAKDRKEEPATDEQEEEAEAEGINEDNANAYEDRQNAKPQVESFLCVVTLHFSWSSPRWHSMGILTSVSIRNWLAQSVADPAAYIDLPRSIARL